MLSDKTTKQIAIWFLAAVTMAMLGGLLYAVTTSWQNANHLSAISGDIKGIKKSLIRMALKVEPGDTAIVDDLLSGTEFHFGVEQFNAGKFPAAYATWERAAAAGDESSAMAIYVATAELKDKLKDSSLQPKERTLVQSALGSAPEVVELDGEYILKKSN